MLSGQPIIFSNRSKYKSSNEANKSKMITFIYYFYLWLFDIFQNLFFALYLNNFNDKDISNIPNGFYICIKVILVNRKEFFNNTVTILFVFFYFLFFRYLLQRINLSCLTVIKKNVFLRRLDVINYSSHGSLRTIIANFRSQRVPSFPFSHLILRSYFFTQLPLLPPSCPSPPL